MSETLELAVVIPTFNELRNVPVLIAKLDAALAGRRWEAIFVDDDSRRCSMPCRRMARSIW